MDAALREFRESMCAEHLDEAAALFDIAIALHRDPHSDWTAPGPFEQRIDAHIDALVIGGEPAETVCDDALAAADDAGACHAAAATIAIRGDATRLRALLQRLVGTPFEAGCAEAVARAFINRLPTALEGEVLSALAVGEAPGADALWRAVAHRRCDTQGLLERALAATTPGRERAATGHRAALWFAATHCADRIDPDAGDPWCDDEDAAVRTQALTCGLRRRGVLATQRLDNPARGTNVSSMLFACAGGAVSARALLDRLSSQPEVDVVLALGVCGNPIAARSLLIALSEPALAEAAALALHLLTGLAPMEAARIEEPVREDELFERERERFLRDGSAPKAADGLPFARHVQRVTQDRSRWQQTLHEEVSHFSAGVRYRFGRAYSVGALLDGLERPHVPAILRQAFVDEALLRHNIDCRFDPATPVCVQLTRLGELKRAATGDTAPPGRWCRSGRIVD